MIFASITNPKSFIEDVILIEFLAILRFVSFNRMLLFTDFWKKVQLVFLHLMITF